MAKNAVRPEATGQQVQSTSAQAIQNFPEESTQENEQRVASGSGIGGARFPWITGAGRPIRLSLRLRERLPGSGSRRPSGHVTLRFCCWLRVGSGGPSSRLAVGLRCLLGGWLGSGASVNAGLPRGFFCFLPRRLRLAWPAGAVGGPDTMTAKVVSRAFLVRFLRPRAAFGLVKVTMNVGSVEEDGFMTSCRSAVKHEEGGGKGRVTGLYRARATRWTDSVCCCVGD